MDMDKHLGKPLPRLAKMPLLKSWEEKLSKTLRVAFLSFDDDARAAVHFLSSQPKGGVRRSYHLGDFGTRLRWLHEIGTMDMLPVQILVDPEGVVQCVALRSVRETDLSEIEKLVGQRSTSP